MTEKLCDLHIHSSCSDGSVSPEELIKIAKAQGLSAVALCDHNTVSGLSRFEGAADGIIAVAGVEITAEFQGKEVHILGLFLPMESRNKITEFLLEINRRKERGNRRLIERLRDGGYDVDYESLLALSGEAIPNRVHVARLLMARGYISTVKEGFDTLLVEGGEFYKPEPKLDAYEVISFLSGVGALPVMAHPFLNLSYDGLREFLPEAKKRGLIGMETVYSLFSDVESRLAASLTEELGLLPSGGSDFHGSNKPDISMGSGKGNISVPFEFYEGLRALSDSREE